MRKIDFLVGRNGGVGGWWVNPSRSIVSIPLHLSGNGPCWRDHKRAVEVEQSQVEGPELSSLTTLVMARIDKDDRR